MWSYYGAKTNIIHHYPPPKYGTVIEPFAGTARYALKYFDRNIILVDKYEVIGRIWRWLQKCSPGDITSLPRFKAGDNINDHIYNCEEERFLVGFLVGFGFTSPRDTATPRLRNRPNGMNYTINRIASQLWKIKDWQIITGDYTDCPDLEATWFIDPPYQTGGHAYVKSNKHLNFENLGEWCKSRKGQVMVCENTSADWMDFKPMIIQNVLSGKTSEAIWTNQKSAFDFEQMKLAI